MNIKKLKQNLIKNVFILKIVDNTNKHLSNDWQLSKDFVYFKDFCADTTEYSILTSDIKIAKKFNSLNKAKIFILKYKLTNYIPIQIEI